MKQTVLVLVTLRMFAKSLATHREKCLCIGYKLRKEMLAGIFTRHNERQLKVMLLHFFKRFRKLCTEQDKKGEKSTFAVDGKIKPCIICYSIV